MFKPNPTLSYSATLHAYVAWIGVNRLGMACLACPSLQHGECGRGLVLFRRMGDGAVVLVGTVVTSRLERWWEGLLLINYGKRR